MIKLGLGKIVPNRRDPSPVVLQALSETVAWCLSRPPQCDQLRSRELDPSAILRVPRFDEIGVGAWTETKRESYQRAVYAINEMRSTLVRDTNVEIAGLAEAQSKGKLLLYEPLETVTDGASESSSRGFFDIEDAPPWDTWFSLFRRHNFQLGPRVIGPECAGWYRREYRRLHSLVQLVRVVRAARYLVESEFPEKRDFE
jgi:hypothetical protein